MKKLIALLSVLLVAPAFATDAPMQPSASPVKSAVHRYLVERTFGDRPGQQMVRNRCVMGSRSQD
jgi:hypothetical protein